MIKVISVKVFSSKKKKTFELAVFQHLSKEHWSEWYSCHIRLCYPSSTDSAFCLNKYISPLYMYTYIYHNVVTTCRILFFYQTMILDIIFLILNQCSVVFGACRSFVVIQRWSVFLSKMWFQRENFSFNSHFNATYLFIYFLSYLFRYYYYFVCLFFDTCK